jgi:hypothetical protein
MSADHRRRQAAASDDRHALIAAAQRRIEELLDRIAWEWNAQASRLLDELLILLEEAAR